MANETAIYLVSSGTGKGYLYNLNVDKSQSSIKENVKVTSLNQLIHFKWVPSILVSP